MKTENGFDSPKCLCAVDGRQRLPRSVPYDMRLWECYPRIAARALRWLQIYKGEGALSSTAQQVVIKPATRGRADPVRSAPPALAHAAYWLSRLTLTFL